MQPSTVYHRKPPNYTYTPSNFMVLSALTVLLCGLLSPPTLALSIPALIYSMKVSMHAHQLEYKYYSIGLVSDLSNTALLIYLKLCSIGMYACARGIKEGWLTVLYLSVPLSLLLSKQVNYLHDPCVHTYTNNHSRAPTVQL